MRRTNLLTTYLLPATLAAVLCCSCVQVGHGEPPTAQPPSAEAKYTSVWRTDVSKMNSLADAMASCDVSTGSPTACREASTNMIAAVQSLRDDLAALDVPPRFADGDSKLRPALDEIVAALTLRNHGLETKSASEFTTGTEQMKTAGSDLAEALALYPPDSGLTIDFAS